MSKVFAVCYGAGHANMVIPVALQLVDAGHDVTVMALTSAWGPVSRAGLPTIGFRDFVDDLSVLELGSLLSNGLGEHPDVHPEESAAYLGMSYRELENNLGVEGAAKAYELIGRQAFFPIKVMSRVMRELSPDLLLTTSSPRAERAAVMVSEDLGIPSVVLVDLLPQIEMDWLQEPGYGDRVCVLSEGVRQHLLRAGRNEEEIVVTGNAAFDELFLMDEPKEREDWRKKFGIAKSDQVLLFASQPDRDWEVGVELGAQLVETCGEYGWKVVVRPHPNEEFDVDRLPPGTLISDRDDTLWGALAGCDACLVVSSTVGLQAAILGKPLVILDVPVCANPAPYGAMGIGRTTNSVAGVFELLESETEFGSFESGPATMRVVRVVESLLEGR